MKTFLSYSITIAAILILFFSCQKEIHFDFISEGTLVKDANNICLATVNGNYVTGKAPDANNYIQVQVNVTARGNYSINTDTLNGYSFSATGEFKDTGLAVVRLTPHGKPTSASINVFNIKYGTSSCNASVTVLDGSTLAIFTLQGSPTSCIIDTVEGGFIKGVSPDTSNKVLIKVNVTTAGTYSISTDTVNGYHFISSGAFLNTGVQNVVLTASGIPVNTGSDQFTVHAGSSVCSFSVSVLDIITVTNPDHFPLTMSSYWDYTDLFYHNNVVTNIVVGSSSKNGNTYTAVEEDISPGGPLILYYRKVGNDYFEFAPVDKYTGSFQYGKKTYDDLLFLREGISKGNSWESPEYSDTASFGQLIGLKYIYRCLDGNATIVITGHAFSNVYIVEMKPQIKGAANIFDDTGEVYTYYYAKGVGLIYFKKMNMNFTLNEWQIKDWQVN